MLFQSAREPYEYSNTSLSISFILKKQNYKTILTKLKVPERDVLAS